MNRGGSHRKGCAELVSSNRGGISVLEIKVRYQKIKIEGDWYGRDQQERRTEQINFWEEAGKGINSK